MTSIPHKPSTTKANPIGQHAELPELDERERMIPELVSFHAKLKVWWYDERRVLLREREDNEP